MLKMLCKPMEWVCVIKKIYIYIYINFFKLNNKIKKKKNKKKKKKKKKIIENEINYRKVNIKIDI